MAALSAILITHNPRSDLLAAALESIERQTLAKGAFEVLVVDNASAPALEETELRVKYALELRVIREPRLGISFARCAGIRAARGEILVFVDDDNRLAADYLERTLEIASRRPETGAFGGICEPLFECRVPRWKMRLLPYLGVRDHGPEPISSRSGEWGEWDPIGAGMVIRRVVGERFRRIVEEHPEAQRLGRAGGALMSGEDTLMARAAWLEGYACSYEPALKLQHAMKAGRLAVPMLARTLYGHGRSYVILQRLLGRPAGRAGWLLSAELVLSYCSRVRNEGLRTGTISWFWDLGRAVELWQNGSRPAAPAVFTQTCHENLDRHP